MKMSTGVIAMKMPERPPIVNVETNDSALIIGAVIRTFPPQSVPSQLNVLMAEGIAMTIVENMNAFPSTGFMPDRNMWCPHTTHERNAIEIIEYAIAW